MITSVRIFLLVALLFNAHLLCSQERYAVIITGESAGSDANESGSWISNSDKTTWDEFWNDTYLIWETLVIDFEYNDDNVFVIYADGEDYSFQGQNIRYKAANHVGYTQITDYAATKNNIDLIFQGLENGTNGFPIIDDDEYGSVKVYPNPGSKCINIEVLADADQISELRIYNSLGKLYYSVEKIPFTDNTSIIKVDISKFPAGIYHYQLILDNHYTKSGKIVKQ